MGSRGPRRKLPQINRLDGNPGKRPIFDADMIEASGELFIPEHLSEDAQGCMELVKQSMPSGIYSTPDSFILSAFATAWALHKLAAHKINDPKFRHTLINANTGTMYPNPWLKILDRQAILIASLGDRLGLDPKSRAALRLPKDQPRSKFAGLIGQHESSSLLRN